MGSHSDSPSETAPWQETWKALAVFGLLVAAGWFLWEVRNVLALFFMAAVAAYLLNPLVSALERWGMSRRSAVALVFAILVGALTVSLYAAAEFFWREMPHLRSQLPIYVGRARLSVDRAQALLAEQWPWIGHQQIFDRLLDAAVSFSRSLARNVAGVLSSLMNVAFYLTVVPFASYFFLLGGRQTFDRVLAACPGRWVEKFLSVVYEIDGVLGSYLRAVFLEAVVVSLLSIAGLMFLGVEHPILIGLAAGLGNLAPYVGPSLGGALGVCVAFFQFGDLEMPLKVVVLFAGVQFMDNWLVQPVIMRRGVDLHPVTLIFVMICGGQVAGAWGLLLAVPVACALKEVAKILSLWYLSEKGLKGLPPDIRAAAAKPWVV